MDLATAEPVLTKRQLVVAWAGRHRRLVTLAVVLLVLHLPFLLIATRIGTPALLLFACLAGGFGLTYLSGLDLVFEERLFYGTVIGAMAMGEAQAALDLTVAYLKTRKAFGAPLCAIDPVTSSRLRSSAATREARRSRSAASARTASFRRRSTSWST